MARPAALLFALVLLGCAPSPDRAPAPGRRFDAGRARASLFALARLGPRPAGSAAAERARTRMAQRLRAAGLFVDTRVVRGRDRRHGVVGEVAAVVAEVPGRSEAALLVTASVDGSPDGPDVAAALGPAVLLELARVLRAGEKPRHTLLFVATESAGRSLGVRGLAEVLPGERRVVLEVALEPRGVGGEAALLWASAGAGPAVEAWSRAVDAPAGGAHLARLSPTRPALRAWPAVAVGTRRALVSPGSTRDRPGAVPLATIRSLGQSVLQLVRAADADDAVSAARRPTGPTPAYLELPLHVVVPFAPGTVRAIGLAALLLAAWALVRLRRPAAVLVTCLPWGAAGAALAVTVMALLSEVLARERGTASPLRGVATAHVASVVLAGAWVLLAWQRLGSFAPVRRIAHGLSQPAVLATLAVAGLAGATGIALARDTALTPLGALPIFAAVPSAIAVARAPDRRGRFVAALPMLFALVVIAGPAFVDAALVLLSGEPRHAELALAIAALAAPVLPALATVTTASVLRPGAGQLGLLAVVTAALSIWTATAPLATRDDPRRVTVTAVSHARPGRSVFLIAASDAVRVDRRRVERPPWAAAIPGVEGAVAFPAPDGLTPPPEVHASLSPRAGGGQRLTARVRSLRRAELLALVLPPATRVVRSSVPIVRQRPKAPWIARVVAPSRQGVELLLDLALPPAKRLSDLVALDLGPGAFGPLAPRIDRAWPTRVVHRAVGVTPLDVTYAAPPPPPELPPDDPAPPPAGPEPWWSIMARERYRRGGVPQPPR